MKEDKTYTYDALSPGGERDKFYTFEGKTAKIRSRILDEARIKVFQDMDDDKNAESTRRASERAIFYYISTGDIIKISQMLEQTSKDETNVNTGNDSIVGDISEDARLQALSIMISGVTLCTRAAIDGGLPETVAYDLSDSYIHHALEITNHRQIMNLISCAVYDFTYEVYKYKYRDCSSLVKKCCEYISRHLHDEITLKTLSELTGKSANYISDSFYKDLNIRPTPYIRKLKLDYACHVLEVADLSISAVSDLLAFPSTSSFITYFKAEYGLTPLQYRYRVLSK